MCAERIFVMIGWSWKTLVSTAKGYEDWEQNRSREARWHAQYARQTLGKAMFAYCLVLLRLVRTSHGMIFAAVDLYHGEVYPHILAGGSLPISFFWLRLVLLWSSLSRIRTRLSLVMTHQSLLLLSCCPQFAHHMHVILLLAFLSAALSST